MDPGPGPTPTPGPGPTPGAGPEQEPAPATAPRRARLAGRRATVDAVLRRSPLQPLFRLTATRRLAVLAYHGVDDPRVFALQMERLVRVTRPVPLAAVEEAVRTGRALPPRSVLVTFDDGDRTVLTEGLPVLTRLGIPAAAFVVTDLIGGDQPFWWTEAAFLAAHGGTARGLADCPPGDAVRRMKTLPDGERRTALAELRESARARAPRQEQLTPADLLTLTRNDVAVGNHTAGHPCLDRCEGGTVRDEIRRAHEALTGWLGGEAPTAFAYPNGNIDPRADAELRRLGYRTGFLFDHRHDRLLPPHPLRISRLRVNSTTGRDRFDTILSGLHPAVHHLRGGS
ncbi:polysaccharide deacetylase family protein [Kitasatospora purpeofusca]|uniref:polysaccharide deacetylase family protein n=1 Tax=Kitasatospora purpeofusca TaxID=67352 RepID=UPI00224DC3E3|nr:polysaccharide deacetylase family protein [Kitasatospora purpeofusca]MCX4689740.1 polysaccharide deacetylase family protein [Kitasatospora purpeofusca]